MFSGTLLVTNQSGDHFDDFSEGEDETSSAPPHSQPNQLQGSPAKSSHRIHSVTQPTTSRTTTVPSISSTPTSTTTTPPVSGNTPNISLVVTPTSLPAYSPPNESPTDQSTAEEHRAGAKALIDLLLDTRNTSDPTTSEVVTYGDQDIDLDQLWEDSKTSVSATDDDSINSSTSSPLTVSPPVSLTSSSSPPPPVPRGNSWLDGVRKFAEHYPSSSGKPPIMHRDASQIRLVPTSSWLREASRYGVSLESYASAEVYSGMWRLYFKTAKPRYDHFDLLQDEQLTCDTFDARLYDAYNISAVFPGETGGYNEGSRIKQLLKDRCVTNFINVKSNLNRSVKTALNRISPYSTGVRVTRRRRAIGALAIIAIASAIAVLTAGVSTLSVVAAQQGRKVDDLGVQLARAISEIQWQQTRTLTIQNQTLTLADLTITQGKRLSDSDNKIKKFQVDFMKEMRRYMKQIKDITTEDVFTKTLNFHALESLQLSQYASNVYQRVLDRVNFFSEAYQSLKNYKLPSSLVSPADLHRALDQMSYHMSPHLEPAIKDTSRYYLEHFTTYEELDDHHILIQLLVPLVKRDEPLNNLVLYMPTFYPIPCTKNCVDSRSTTQPLYKLLDRQRALFAFDRNNDEMYVANARDWICRPYANARFCYTFQTEALATPEGCHKAIATANYTQLFNKCKLEASSRISSYKPVPITMDIYQLHYFRNISFDYECNGRVTAIPVKPDSTYLKKLEPGCTIKYKSKTIYPRRENLSPEMEVFREGYEPFALTRHGLHPSIRGGLHPSPRKNDFLTNDFFSEFNESEYLKPVILPDEEISALISQIEEGQKETEARVNAYATYRERPTTTSGWLIPVFDFGTTTFMTLITALLLFASVRSGNFIYLLAPTIIIRPARVSCWPAMFTSPVAPDSIESFQLSDEVVKITQIVLVLSLIVFTVFGARFRKTFLTTHVGRFENKGVLTRFLVVIEFKLIRQTFCASYAQKITLRTPLRIIDLPSSVVSVELSEQTIPWAVTRGKFELIEPVLVRGKLDDGTFCFKAERDIEIPMSKIEWLTNIPIGFHINGYGLAHIRCVGQPIVEMEQRL